MGRNERIISISTGVSHIGHKKKVHLGALRVRRLRRKQKPFQRGKRTWQDEVVESLFSRETLSFVADCFLGLNSARVAVIVAQRTFWEEKGW